MQHDVEIAALTCGPKGSVIVTADEVIEVPAHPVEQVVDTTGRRRPLRRRVPVRVHARAARCVDCGRLGSVAASAVLGHTGARPGLSLAQLAEALGT